jgi:hypothetical protein
MRSERNAKCKMQNVKCRNAKFQVEKWFCFFAPKEGGGAYDISDPGNSATPKMMNMAEILAKTLTRGIFRVINHYHENNHYDFDRQTPDGIPTGLVPAGRVGARRSVERVRPGQRWFVDSARQGSRTTGCRKTLETNTRWQTFASSGGKHCQSGIAPSA